MGRREKERMARSRRRTPIIGHTTAASEKPDKQHANRNCRAALRSALKLDPDGVLPTLRNVSDPWAMAKDGRQWIGDRYPKLMRK